MNAWWLFTHQAQVPPREPIVPKRQSCAWCGVMLRDRAQRKYCSVDCCSRANYFKRVAKKARDQSTSV